MFAVFGKSYEAAKKKALKLTPTHTGTGASYRKLTDAEYQQALAENTEKLFAQMKPVALSKEYSSPEICTEFMRLAERQGYHGLTVRIKAPVQKKDTKAAQKSPAGGCLMYMVMITVTRRGMGNREAA